MNHESEMNQDIIGLDMAKGLHQDNLRLKYSQNFMHAPHSAYPQKNPHSGMACNPKEIMAETMHAKK